MIRVPSQSPAEEGGADALDGCSGGPARAGVRRPARVPSLRWLGTTTGRIAHLVFLGLISVLTCAGLTGGPLPEDYPTAWIFCGIGYPAVLGLAWVQWRINGRGEF